jgi:RimJ/RimL family protein N-acetyltransferase
MSEATKRIIEFAFQELGLRRLNIEAFVENEASNNLIKKVGFIFEGTQKQGTRAKATGKLHDSNQYRLLKEEWEQEG